MGIKKLLINKHNYSILFIINYVSVSSYKKQEYTWVLGKIKEVV